MIADTPSTCPRHVTLGVADADPYPAYRDASDAVPVAWDDGFGGWILLRHADCSRVLRDVETFVMPWASFDGGEIALGKYGIFNLRGEFHERMHKKLLDYFNPRRNKDLVGQVRHFVREAFDAVADQPTFEFHREIAERVPGLMAFGFLGVPADLDVLNLIHDANGALQRFMQSYAGGAAEIASLHAAHASLLPHFGPTIRARRDERRNDLISELWNFADGRADWGEDEMIRQCLFYFGASFGNTAGALSNAVYTMLTVPGHREELRAHPELLSTYGDEVLRAWAAVQFRIRVATRDVEITGTPIRAGEKVILAVGAANRDEEVFANPDEVEFGRKNVLRHLTFGAGPRYCVGATLARVEIEETLRELDERYAELEIEPAASPPEFLGVNYRHFGPLVLRGHQSAPTRLA